MAISTISLGKVKFNWRGTWAVTTAYVKDDVFSYGANAYIVTISHVSTLVFADNQAKVDTMVEGVENAGVYSAGTLYKKNDIVTYGGAVYIAVQSSTGQSPSNASYWSSLVGGFQFLSTYSGSITYKKGDIVSYGGNNYIATQDTLNHIPTDATYWTLFNQGFTLQGVYSGSTAYKIGQVVSYGANSYVAVQDTTAGILPTNATYWTPLTSGQITVGEYGSGYTYKTGDLVQYGGYIYVAKSATTGNAPNNLTYWTQAQTGFRWSQTWGSGTTYQKGEVVQYNGSSYVSIAFDNNNNIPDAGILYWLLMMQGSANNVYTTTGDIAIRNASAIVRLPVGASGQALTVGTDGIPHWEDNGITGKVYYVAINGVDASGYGSSLQRPFATLQYATQTVQTPCTIFVKAGTYEEQLPITVPANCAIVGDSLRNTFVNPKLSSTVTATYASSNIGAFTFPTLTNGTTSYVAIRTTILNNIETIKNGVISFLATTYPSLNYNQEKCRRDTGLIVNAVLTDLVFGSNYLSTKAGLTYLRSYSSVVTSSQKAQTIAGINKARDLALTYTADSGAQTAITTNMAIVTNIINTGVSAFSASALTYPNPTGIATDYSNSKLILIANRSFIQAEIVAWIAANYTIANIPGYDANTCSRDVGYVIDAMIFDITYGGNTQIIDAAASYYTGGTNIDAAEITVTVAAYNRLKTIVQQIVQNQTVSKSAGNAATQNTGLSVGSVTVASTLLQLSNNLIAIEQDGLTLTVSSNSNITVGTIISGNGFKYGQKVVGKNVDGTTIVVSAGPTDIVPSGALTFTTKRYSLDLIQVENNLSTMFLVGDGALLKQMTFNGMIGFSPSNSDVQDITTATIGGVFVRLNPNSPIINKSPYITDCSAFSTGGTGVIVDGSVHTTGNKSMVFHAFTNIHDGGVGFWMKDNAKAEIVSCFTYYCWFGYATSGGAKIRSLNGNNSYGTYGIVSRGYDVGETPITGTVWGNQITYNSNSLNGNGFTTADTLTGLTSGARASVTNVQSGSYKVYYKRISGTFASGETITGSVTGTSAVIATGGNSGQKGFVIVATGLTAYPIIGTSIEFDGDTSAYVIQQVSTWVNTSSVVQIVMAQEKVVASLDGTAIRIRANFSQTRLTGHDFLSIGTGGVSTTNYPGYPTQSAAPGNQTVEIFPGRVFYIATDQDGNFKVGNYFAVNQATGTATLNANAFNLSGLSALRLGSVGAQLGELISEFSSDVTLGADSNTKVPTQHAVKTYVDVKVANSFPSYLTVGTTPKSTVGIYAANGVDTGSGANTDVINVTVAGVQVAQFTNTKHTFTPGGNTAFEAGYGYMQVPYGPTTGSGGRPSSAFNGYIRYNTDLSAFEGYVAGQWTGIGGGNPWQTKTSAYTAINNDRLFVDTTSAAVTITLPSSPSVGDNVRLVDVAGKFNTNNLTVGRNTKLIMGLSEDLTVANKYAAFSLVYSGATYGWVFNEN